MAKYVLAHERIQVVSARGDNGKRKPGVPTLRQRSDDMQIEVGAREFGGCELCDQFRHEGTRGAPSGAYRCGLTGETLSESEVSQICVNFAAR